MDPFHDYDVPINGMPDHDTGDTVVQLLKKQLTIRRPANVEGTWDCHITSLPILTGPNRVSVGTINGIQGSAFFSNQTGPTQPLTTKVVNPNSFVSDIGIGTVSIVTCASGSDTYPTQEAFNPSGQMPYNPAGTHEFFRLDAVNPGPSAQAKLIAGGFEVHNDTADLYKQGNLTVYSSPQSRNPTALRQLTLSETIVFANVDVYRSPPGNKTEAVLLPNSRTWTAEQGCMVPFILDTDHSSFSQSTNTLPLFRHEEESYPTSFEAYPGTGQSRPSEVGFTAVPWSPTGTAANLVSNNYKPASIVSTGAYFSGLSPETVLTLDVRFYVELRPTAANETLTSLASPTAPYDRLALDMYAELRGTMPVGVPVAMNAHGDWWRMATKQMADVALAASPLLTVMSPTAGAVSALVGTTARGANQILSSRPRPPTPARKQSQKQAKSSPNNTMRTDKNNGSRKKK